MKLIQHIQLRITTLNNTVSAHYFTKLYKVWLNYPPTLPSGAEKTFFLRNRQTEGRPTAILAHRFMAGTANAGVMLAQNFYTGHSYKLQSAHYYLPALSRRLPGFLCVSIFYRSGHQSWQ